MRDPKSGQLKPLNGSLTEQDVELHFLVEWAPYTKDG